MVVVVEDWEVVEQCSSSVDAQRVSWVLPVVSAGERARVAASVAVVRDDRPW